ncbi:hypothetical protein WSM22_00320 [Cytophagales bacterium WSM2-2]|nr:hypothetical protein WSM22_00320 [Cytophagales bacterium WSM2-2]
MWLKIFKVFWFFSLLTVLGIFMYVYAGLPDPVALGEGSGLSSFSKETVFYIVLAALAITNTLVFAVTRLLPEHNQDFKAWFYGLVACANLFFVVGLSFLSVYNSNEKYDYSQIGIIIYSSLILLVLWSMSWPIYLVTQKFFRKQAV